MGNADLVLEGGGVKGIGLLGAVSTLSDAGYEFGGLARVAGTSAGAIVGSLLATGAPIDELTEVMRGLDYRRFRDGSRLGRLGNAFSLLSRLGFYRGDWLHQWIADRLAERGVRTFGDLRITNDAHSALPANRRYRLVVVVSDISRGRMVRLPWDYQAHYGLDPDAQSVADAVRASASIPFFFRPWQLQDARGGPPSCCTDGGMLSNFPVHMFDRDDNTPPRWPTFGVKLSTRPAHSAGPSDGVPIHGLVNLSKALINTMIEAHDRLDLEDPSVLDRTIFVDTDGVGTTDFGLDAAHRETLFGNGRRAAEEFLAGWDFAAWQRLHPLPTADVG
jgi:NTE family protein